MLNMKVDLSQLKVRLSELKAKLESRDYLLPAAAELVGNMRYRIHVLGENNDNAPIGQYSAPYLLYRKSKGKGSSSKVILSFTGRLASDLTVIPLANGAVGIGYLSSEQKDLSDKLENQYQQFIFTPSKDEEQEAINTILHGVRAIL